MTLITYHRGDKKMMGKVIKNDCFNEFIISLLRSGMNLN